jgi:hypothetical protein
MNATVTEKSSLDVIFPESRKVTVARLGAAEPEIVEIYPLPLQKWKQGFKYIAQIAPMLGFNLFEGQLNPDQVKDMSANELLDRAEQLTDGDDTPADSPIDVQKIYDAIMGDGSDLIIEFLAFAIDKDVSFFDGMYDEIIDITVAVIELNLNFFIQRLLPKVLTGTKDVLATAAKVKQAR